MAKQSVTIEGVEYKSRTDAAKALVAAGKTLTEAADATGMTYQTVYANTKGADKVGKRRARYRVLSMGKSGKRTASDIAKKTGLSVSAVVSLLKKNGVVVVTKESKAAAKAAKKAPRQKVVNPENVIKVPDPIDEVPLTPAQVQAEEEINEIPEDAAAAAQALAGHGRCTVVDSPFLPKGVRSF